MTTPFSGGCACGKIRYICTAAPIAMLNCHCQDCQISSGAPFASGIIVALASTQVKGAPSTYTVTAISGGKTVRSFCDTCGTPLFTRGEAIPDFMSIRFPTLDDPTMFKPMLDIFVSRAQPWTCVDTNIPQFEMSPPSAA
ncbi:GFA family protein [Candidatus Methylobacter oryzae]|uniref:GFA family protein n=1 Tax=Candidatus Methylobacter oryzae TaxID=2497749 RepID=A0ABY3CH58_9GAMM|nr:GFA family protein [Candidatus Methylobacter oryzae]TRX03301.1 GFA family protein [Candidatus Methylobacter oryzae]